MLTPSLPGAPPCSKLSTALVRAHPHNVPNSLVHGLISVGWTSSGVVVQPHPLLPLTLTLHDNEQ